MELIEKRKINGEITQNELVVSKNILSSLFVVHKKPSHISRLETIRILSTNPALTRCISNELRIIYLLLAWMLESLLLNAQNHLLLQVINYFILLLLSENVNLWVRPIHWTLKCFAHQSTYVVYLVQMLVG